MATNGGMSSSSGKNLLEGYHRIAAETLLGSTHLSGVNASVLKAAADGECDTVEQLLAQYKSAANARCHMTGDTPLIAAARNSNSDVVEVLMRRGADVTLQNDSSETALDVASPALRKLILGCIRHEDRAMSNAQALLQTAWLGDAVSLKKHLGGSHYLSLDCRNSDGMTPLLLVTRDMALFDQVQVAMETQYNPVAVLQELLDSQADVSHCDGQGRSALHLVASSHSVHAKKMVSLLVQKGSSVDAVDNETYSPLHLSTREGHLAIIVALVEEGGADVNSHGGQRGVTPLILSARGGHDEAAKYLLAKGADITAVDDNGDSALTVAKTTSMVQLLKEAWTEHSHQLSAKVEPMRTPSPETTPTSPVSADSDNEEVDYRGSPEGVRGRETCFFLTDRQLSQSLDLGEMDFTGEAFEDGQASSSLSAPSLPPYQCPPRGKFPPQTNKNKNNSNNTNDVTALKVDTPFPSHRSEKEPANIRRPYYRSEETEAAPLPLHTPPPPSHPHRPHPPLSEAEADDEREEGGGGTRKPATRRTLTRDRLQESVSRRRSGGGGGGGGGGERRRERHFSPKNSVGGDYRTRSLPRHMTSRHDNVAYSSADEDFKPSPRLRSREQSGTVSHGNRGSNGGRSKRLAALYWSHDRVLSRSHDSLVGSCDQDDELFDKALKLPEVVKTSASPRSKVLRKVSKSADRLPFLNRMRPVAMVAVDTEREHLRVQHFRHSPARAAEGGGGAVGGAKAGKVSPITRSKSLMNVSSSRLGEVTTAISHTHSPSEPVAMHYWQRKRNSTGSVMTRHSDARVSLLPSVVTPQLGFQPPPGGGRLNIRQHPPTTSATKTRTRLKPLKLSSSSSSPSKRHTLLPSPSPPPPPPPPPPGSGGNILPSQLSIVNEDSESTTSSSDITAAGRTFTKSSSDLTGGGGGGRGLGSKDSTLKASSHSDFETDSLERHGVVLAAATATVSTAIGGAGIPFRNVSDSRAAAVVVEERLSGMEQRQPPGMERRQSGQNAYSPSQPSNLMVNYAVADGSNPLSPIWNQMQYLRSDSDSSEYITSYIGHMTPLPRVQAPFRENRRMGAADSGHGESTDEERGGQNSGSSSEEGEEEEGGAPAENPLEVMRWKRGRLLGKGAYGKVWEGLMDSAKLIAVKEVELDPECPEKAQSQYEKIQLEVEILRSLRHRNIVSYLGTSLQYGTVYIFMDFISGGSLQSILKRFGPLDERTVSHYTRQTCRGLLYIHSNAIIHRDIKGANIMVTSRGVVKLIDFGCAKKYCQEMSNNMHSVRGTPYWMAPEVICGHGYGRKSDIWSLGCTVHEMALTKPPWADFPPEAAMFQIGIGKAVPAPPDHLSPTIREFFYSCLTRDPGERPSAAQLLEHRFLAMATPSRRPSDT